LYITGISLGGGLACLSFIDINHDKIFNTIKVVTFGAPRVGNKAWAKHFNAITNSESRRYLIKGDPITILPKCFTFFCGYRHTGIKIVCNKKKQVCKQAVETDDNVFTNALTTFEDFSEEVQNIDFNEFTEETEVEGLIDHIYGYPKIHSFTLIINGKVVTE